MTLITKHPYEGTGKPRLDSNLVPHPHKSPSLLSVPACLARQDETLHLVSGERGRLIRSAEDAHILGDEGPAIAAYMSQQFNVGCGFRKSGHHTQAHASEGFPYSIGALVKVERGDVPNHSLPGLVLHDFVSLPGAYMLVAKPHRGRFLSFARVWPCRCSSFLIIYTCSSMPSSRGFVSAEPKFPADSNPALFRIKFLMRTRFMGCGPTVGHQPRSICPCHRLSEHRGTLYPALRAQLLASPFSGGENKW